MKRGRNISSLELIKKMSLTRGTVYPLVPIATQTNETILIQTETTRRGSAVSGSPEVIGGTLAL